MSLTAGKESLASERSGELRMMSLKAPHSTLSGQLQVARRAKPKRHCIFGASQWKFRGFGTRKRIDGWLSLNLDA